MTKEVVKLTALDRARNKPTEMGKLSFNDVMGMVEPTEVINASEALGNGFQLASEKDKTRLINVPFVIMDWKINPNGKFGEFATLFIITGDDRHLILNDGGQGITPQLKELREEGFTGVIVCKHGLSVSEYPVFEDAYESDGVTPIMDSKTGEQLRVRSTDEKGNPLTGRTYRINLED